MATGGAVGILLFLMFIGTAACLMMIIKAGLVDGMIDTGTTLVVILAFLLVSGMVMASQQVVLIVLWSLITVSASFVLKKIGGSSDQGITKRLREEDIARYQRAIATDPRNVSARKALGDLYVKGGLYEEAITQYKEAIKLEPPEVMALRRRLNEAIDLREGKSIETTICRNCKQETPLSSKTCTHCGEPREKGFLEWAAKPENTQYIVRQSVMPMLIAVGLLTIFSALPMELKACVLVASAIVAAFYLLRGIGG